MKNQGTTSFWQRL